MLNKLYVVLGNNITIIRFVPKPAMIFVTGRRRYFINKLSKLYMYMWVLGSIPGLATYFRFSFRFFKKGSCQLLAKVCARSTG